MARKPDKSTLMAAALRGDEDARLLCIKGELEQGELSPICRLWLTELADEGCTDAQNIYCGYVMSYSASLCDRERLERFCRSLIVKSPGIGYSYLAELYLMDEDRPGNLQQAEECLQKAVDAGDEEACYRLASIWYESCPEEHSPEEIRALIEQTSLTMCPEEIYDILAKLCLKMGDEAASLKYVRKWLREYPDDIDALLRIAYYYATGLCVQKNFTNALKYYQKAANLGDSLGMYYVGIINYTGEAGRRNYGRAVDYLRRAIAAGCNHAKALLATCYLNGHGVKVDVQKALQLLNEGAKENIAECCVLRSAAYAEGNYVEKNLPLALELISRAEEYAKDDPFVTFENIQSVKKKLEERLSSAQPEEKVLAFLQKFREHCFSVSKESKSAMNALMIEGLEFVYDWRVRHHIFVALMLKSCSAATAKKVVSKLCDMAEKDNAGAALLAGDAYYHGHGVPCDYEKAYQLYRKSWSLCRDEAACIRIFLGLHERHLHSTDEDVNHWLSLLIKLFSESFRVIYLQGLLHSVGLYLPEDKVKAEAFFAKLLETEKDIVPADELRNWQCGAKTLRACLRV